MEFKITKHTAKPQAKSKDSGASLLGSESQLYHLPIMVPYTCHLPYTKNGIELVEGLLQGKSEIIFEKHLRMEIIKPWWFSVDLKCLLY